MSTKTATFLDNSIPFDELEQRRQKANEQIERRKPSQKDQPEYESEAMNRINEIFNPTLKLPMTKGPYQVPDEIRADDADAFEHLDVRKIAELKEVFLLFDTDCDGLISKNDLRFTFTALGSVVDEDTLEEMLSEAKEPLDFDAFFDLMSHRTIELDPEDVLLEAWSKWDEFGTGKVEEKNCRDHIEVFPFLREAVVENTTQPEGVICQQQTKNGSSLIDNSENAIDQPYIYSGGRTLGLRVRFQKPKTTEGLQSWTLNITGDYQFLKKDKFKNDGRLITGSFCDYYFFADADEAGMKPKGPLSDVWQYFHSPRFPANYPAHIKCAYKFIGRPESLVEIIFEELHIPDHENTCNLDKLIVFDAEAANMNAVIDVLCDALPPRRLVSSGPDLLIEFNASSNLTAKGFRGKFKFIPNVALLKATTNGITTTTVTTPTNGTRATMPTSAGTPITSSQTMPTVTLVMEKVDVRKEQQQQLQQKQQAVFKSQHPDSKDHKYKDILRTGENCNFVFDSRANKTGRFESSQLFTSGIAPNMITQAAHRCRYEFYGGMNERVQIKFLDFYIPTDGKNSSECRADNSLQVLSQVRHKFEAIEYMCGAFLPKPLMSKGSNLLLQFIGQLPAWGSKVAFYGFKAEYKFITNFGITTGEQKSSDCNFVFNSTLRKSGWFGSPNFPGLYPHNVICNYYFYGEGDETVSIRFTFFDVEGIGTCDFLTASDYVEFSNFMSTDRKFSKYCGKHDKFQQRSDGIFFRVTFFSNDRFDKTGFRALYDFETGNVHEENVSSMQSYISNGISRQWTTLCFKQFLIFCALKILTLFY